MAVPRRESERAPHRHAVGGAAWISVAQRVDCDHQPLDHVELQGRVAGLRALHRRALAEIATLRAELADLPPGVEARDTMNELAALARVPEGVAGLIDEFVELGRVAGWRMPRR